MLLQGSEFFILLLLFHVQYPFCFVGLFLECFLFGLAFCGLVLFCFVLQLNKILSLQKILWITKAESSSTLPQAKDFIINSICLHKALDYQLSAISRHIHKQSKLSTIKTESNIFQPSTIQPCSSYIIIGITFCNLLATIFATIL